MLEEYPAMELFRAALRESLRHNARQVETITVEAGNHVYSAGERADMVYIVDDGEVKLLATGPTGRECLLAVETAGDVVGEHLFSGIRRRPESAIAMRTTRLLRMPRAHFLERLARENLLIAFIGYLSARIAEQNGSTVSFATEGSERRLAGALLALARKIGSHDAASNAILPVFVSHEDLAAMIGTTRPRVSVFMQKFRHLDLVAAADQQRLIVREGRLAAYLQKLQ